MLWVQYCTPHISCPVEPQNTPSPRNKVNAQVMQMRPYGIRVGLEPVTGILIKVGNLDTEICTEDRVRPRETEAGRGMMRPPV